MAKTESKTALLEALIDIDRALADNIKRSQEIRRRVLRYQEQLQEGVSLETLIHAEKEPRTVALITENMTILEGVGSSFRQALARSLRDEGLTIAKIADLFGVTRQRISALLRQR